MKADIFDIVAAQSTSRRDIFDTVAESAGTSGDIFDSIAPDYNPRDEQISAAPTFTGELGKGNYLNAAQVAGDTLKRWIAPTQRSPEGAHLLGTFEEIPHTPDENQFVSGGKELINTVNQTAAGLTSPDTLSGLILPPLGLAQMAFGVPDIAKQISDADKTPAGSPERWKAGLSVAELMGLAALGGRKARESVLRPQETTVTPQAPDSSAASSAQSVAQAPLASDVGRSAGHLEMTPIGVTERQLTQSPNVPQGVQGAAPESSRVPSDTVPTFAEGKTPEEKAQNFVEPLSDAPLPSAVRFNKGEIIPSELGHEGLGRMETSDGGTIVFDSEIHTPDDFADINATLQTTRKRLPDELVPKQPVSTMARQMQREHEAELIGNAHDQLSASGHELLDAIEKAGGLPVPGSDVSGPYRGELRNILEMAKGGRQVGVKGVFTGRLFRKTASDVDTLATSLRDYGFDVQTPSDVFDLIDERLRTGRPIYGQPELAQIGGGNVRAAELPIDYRGDAKQGDKATRQPSAGEMSQDDIKSARELLAGSTSDEKAIQSRLHWVALDPVTGEPHELFGDFASARDYMATMATSGEKLVARKPGKPDRVVKQIPHSPASRHQAEVYAANSQGLTGEPLRQRLEEHGRTAKIRRQSAEDGSGATIKAEATELSRQDPEQRQVGQGQETPRLRQGEKGTGDLFQGEDQPFNLAGEHGADYGARQKQAESEAAKTLEAQRSQDAAQSRFKLGRRESGAIDLDPLRDRVEPYRQELEARPLKDRVAYGKDAADTRAAQIARQAGNAVRLDFGSVSDANNPRSTASRDLAAAPFVIEAGSKKELAADIAKMRAGNSKLAAKYVPVAQHALANFDRLNALRGTHDSIAARQLAIERRAGIKVGERENYVSHVLHQSPEVRALEPVLVGGKQSGGMSRYFTRTATFDKLADAIAAGYDPKSTNLANLLEHRVATGQRLLQQRRLFNQLRELNAPDGRPIIGEFAQHQPFERDRTTELGLNTPVRPRPERQLPPGYTSVDANGTPIVVHKQFAGLFKALYGDSAIRRSGAGRLLMNYTAIAKQGTLMLDTYHVGRVMYKELAYSKGRERVGYNKGLSLLEFRDADLERAVSAGDISRAQAKYAKHVRPKADLLIKHGLNVGGVSDNLAGQLRGIPGLRVFNNWIFQKLSRGSMLQTAVHNLDRNMARFPERGLEGNARQTAREMNEVFGNLQSQGLFKSKSLQDAARVVTLAPQWTESQLRAELRGYGQIARAPVDLIRGAAKGKFRLGVVAQGQITAVGAMLAANQVINYITTGHSTFQNEDGHWLDAFIPGGTRGFWFNPLEIAAEYGHAAMKYLAQHENPVDVATHVAANKLSPLARGVKDYLTGRDYAGRPFANHSERVRASIADAFPSPLPLSGVLEKDPRAPLGYRWNRQPGALEKQAFQSIGMKLTPEQSPQSKMYALAHDYRDDRGYRFPPSPYTEMRHALDAGQAENVKAEILSLARQGHTRDQILHGVGIKTGQKTRGQLSDPRYTANHDSEQRFKSSLTPAQRFIYDKANLEHAMQARRLQQILNTIDPSVFGIPEYGHN